MWFAGCIPVFITILHETPCCARSPATLHNSLDFCLVVRLDGKTPVRYGLRLNRDDTFFELRKQLSEKCKLAIENILLVEMASNTIKVSITT